MKGRKKVMVSDRGDIVEIGAAEEIFTNPKAERSRIFLSRVLKK